MRDGTASKSTSGREHAHDVPCVTRVLPYAPPRACHRICSARARDRARVDRVQHVPAAAPAPPAGGRLTPCDDDGVGRACTSAEMQHAAGRQRVRGTCTRAINGLVVWLTAHPVCWRCASS